MRERTSYKHVWYRSALRRMHGEDTTKCEMNARSQSARKGHMAAATTIIRSMELTYENTIAVPASQRRINKPVRPMYDAAWAIFKALPSPSTMNVRTHLPDWLASCNRTEDANGAPTKPTHGSWSVWVMNHTQCHAPGRSNNRTHETDAGGHATTVMPHGQVTSQDPCVGKQDKGTNTWVLHMELLLLLQQQQRYRYVSESEREPPQRDTKVDTDRGG